MGFQMKIDLLLGHKSARIAPESPNFTVVKIALQTDASNMQSGRNLPEVHPAIFSRAALDETLSRRADC